jgi:hypothetical protein
LLCEEIFMRRFQLVSGGVAMMAGIAVIIGTLLAVPTSAKSTDGILPALTCSTPNPCLFWTNTSTGNAMRGVSYSGFGIQGITKFPSTKPQNARAGVIGRDQSTSGFNDDGVRGESSQGYGTYGVGQTGAEGDGSIYGVVGKGAAIGVYGIHTGADTSGTGVLAVDLLGSGILYEGIDNHGTDKFIVDGVGNVFGHSFQATLLKVHQVTSAGPAVTTYSTQSSSPTLEDYGEAQLSGGSAHVSIERTFATTIDRSAGYLVFITPEGDTRGLYVTQKTSGGFTVRENQGGRSTVAFQYRIVARPLGVNAARLPASSGIPQMHPAK